MFVHLHNHSDGSTADAILKPKDIAKAAKKFGQPAVALTDHGVMFKLIEFYKACKAEGVKPILGMETYVAPRSNTRKVDKFDAANYHLVLLAENLEGYHNLIHIASNASLEGMYYKPRTDKWRLKEWSKGIIALSACLGGEVQDYLIQGEYEKAKEAALQYDEIFGRGNFFLELQDHNIDKDKIVIEGLLKLHKETGIPLVATNDCHYLKPEDSIAHDVLLCIRDKKLFDDPKRMRYDSDQMYFKSTEEMEKLFSFCPEAIENTVKIADRCNVEIEFGKNKLPPYHIPDGYNSKREYIEELVYQGAEKKYSEITDELRDRITFELDTVEKMGYLEYFLIVWDFIKAAREKGILVGPGRGCLKNNAKVALGDGTYKFLSDVQIGDEVFTHTGKIQKVTNVMKYSVEEEMIRIKSTLGTIDCTKDHKIFVLRNNELQWVEACKVTFDDKVVCPKVATIRVGQPSYNEYIYGEIESLCEYDYNGFVYDIAVPGDTSYIANDIAVHNSGAGSAVCYCLDITQLDPLKYNLLFERFLDPSRISMPKILGIQCEPYYSGVYA